MKQCPYCNWIAGDEKTLCYACGCNLVPEAAREARVSFGSAPGYPALQWSAEKPRAAGWWGYHNGVAQPPVIVRVWESVSMPGKLYAAMGDYGIDVVSEMAGWWFGPIELPDPFARTTPDNNGAQRQNPAEGAP